MSLALLPAIASCSAVDQTMDAPAEEFDARDVDVLESACRKLFDLHDAQANRVGITHYFLYVGGEPKLEPAVITRFVNHVPVVETWTSASTTWAGGVRHRETRERGILFRVTRVHWIDEDNAEVEASSYTSSRGGSGYSFQVRRRDGKWVVADESVLWTS